MNLIHFVFPSFIQKYCLRIWMILNINIPPHPIIWDTATKQDSKNSDIGQDCVHIWDIHTQLTEPVGLGNSKIVTSVLYSMRCNNYLCFHISSVVSQSSFCCMKISFAVTLTKIKICLNLNMNHMFAKIQTWRISELE